ncbi:MAG: DUF1232 domain-containing protein [Arenimonas sp.]|uniref:DUF1232 domain-containing protein n=1 Tax=Arenimonas sp. TaxID=1872635 RepID=UPI0025BED596|nr:YkvA family protein [Arenimonas sp.]MBW8368601.1 DUF1232 domain-containing protein [Arenimonas sp.]
MKITFELDAGDIDRFHDALARAERRVACADECDIVDAARHALGHLPIAAAPGYIRRQIEAVAGLLAMVEDDAWALPPPERTQVLRLLAYFSDPDDLIPDDVEVIGLLDDAIMLELLMKQVRHVVAAYAEFTEARAGLPAAADSAQRIALARTVARLRARLHARMRRRTVRDAVAGIGAAGLGG